MGKVSTRKEIRESVLDTTRQTESQIGSLVNDFINITLNEISDPAWAFQGKNYNYLWSFLRRKTTFDTVASTEDYVLPRDVSKIQLIRQTESPGKLIQVPDELFYELVPDPTDEGNPRFYRLWSQEGVATKLAVADTINVVSSSTSDAGSADKSVTVSGYSSGIKVTEVLQLNGTTAVTGSTTFDAREIFISKGANTVGNVTVTEASGATTLLVLGKEERSPRFKVCSLYPIPSSAITMYVEYYTRMKQLQNDSDVPEFDENWHWVVRMGALAKVYQYLNKETDFAMTQAGYAAGVRSMSAADAANPDLIRHLHPKGDFFPFFYQKRSEDEITV